MTLPEFLILGAPKCGTTALADALGAHPELFVPERKEPNFFDVNWDRGLDWFAQHFTPAANGQLRGEATPAYFATPIAAERIAQTNPGCKMIVLVREPVSRAHSHYWFRWNTGRERRSIDEVIADELSSPAREAEGYMIRHGMYARNLRRYRELFGADGIHVIGFDELVKEPARVIAECEEFLGVAKVPIAIDHANQARTPRDVLFARTIQILGGYQGAPKRILRALIGENTRRVARLALQKLLSRAVPNPPLPPRTRARLVEIFADDWASFRAATGK
jgi:hypothetical protein